LSSAPSEGNGIRPNSKCIGSISRGSSYSSSQDKPKGRKEDFSRIIVLKDGIFLS
jgi:hypothetical protein